MRPFTELIAPGDPDLLKEVAAEILRHHQHEEKESWLAGVRQPLNCGPRPSRSGAVALKGPS